MSETKNAAPDKAKAACPGHMGFERRRAIKDSRRCGVAVLLLVLVDDRRREQEPRESTRSLLTSMGLPGPLAPGRMVARRREKHAYDRTDSNGELVRANVAR